MRSVLSIAILSVLAASVVSQKPPTNTTNSPSSSSGTNNATAPGKGGAGIPPANPNGIFLPDKVIVRAQLADLSSDVPIALQWKSRAAVFTYAWDFLTNSYSEEWRTDSTLIFSRQVRRSQSVGFSGGKCLNATDATNWATAIRGLFASFNVPEGLVSDPFIPESGAQLNLWRDQQGRNWVWLDPNTNDIVYFQTYRAEWKKHIALYFPTGL